MRTVSDRRAKSAGSKSGKAIGSTPNRLPVWAYAISFIVFAFAWSTSFSGVFLLDDLVHIAGNPKIRSIWPIWDCLGDSARPLVDISLAINFAIGGFEPFGYHVFNLFVHLATGMALWGLIRRTMRRAGYGTNGSGTADVIALGVAVIWLVHPLTTQAVTYVIQRGESMMSLFYVLTLYCLVRGEQGPGRNRWYILSVLACAAGFLCKGVMVTAPVAALLYDRAFLAATWKETFSRRWRVHLGLAATWGVLFALGLVQLLFRADTHGAGTVGFHVSTVTPKAYLLSQAGVLLHYLRLSIWPHPLVFDYMWPQVSGIREAIVPGLIVIVLLASGIVMMIRRPAVGFVIVVFFLFLSPTSSFVPIADLCVEHRMYLPLACVVTIGVLAISTAARRLSLQSSRSSLIFLLAIAIVFSVMTHSRNRDYASEEAMWRSVIEDRPENYRAYDHLGTTLMDQNRLSEAIAAFQNALRIKPDMPVIENNLANAYARSGNLDEAIALFQHILSTDPSLPRTHLNLALALQMQGKTEEAVQHYDVGLTPEIQEAGAWRNYALALQQVGRLADAEQALRRALQLLPNDATGYVMLGALMEKLGQRDEALLAYRQALRLNPSDANVNRRVQALSGVPSSSSTGSQE